MLKGKISEKLVKLLLERGYIFRARKGVFRGLDRELEGDMIITEIKE